MFFMRTMVGDRLNQINMPRLYAYAAFVRAVPNTASAGQMADTKSVHRPSHQPDCLHIVLSAPAGALQARVQWPIGQLGASSAWLREVLA